jgi:hypothetical protein
MSYTFDDTYEVAGTSNWKPQSATNFWMGLVLDGSGLAASGQPSATNLNLVTNLNECNYSNYARKQLTGVSLTGDTTAHWAKWRFDPVTFSNLGSSIATEVVGAFIYQGTSSTGRPRHYFDTSPLFPFSGGGDKVIVSPTLGAVRISG